MMKLWRGVLSLFLVLCLINIVIIPPITAFAENVMSAEDVLPPAAHGPTPSAAQLRAHKEEMFAFIHFGMNTFTGIEWGSGLENPNSFTLTNEQLDTDQWASMFKNAGFGRLMFVGKHHDGFCNWPSAFTEHSVKNAPGKVDVLGRLSESCTKYDLDMGLYMSPWDVNSPYYGDSSQGESVAYNNYFMNQLHEIMGNPAYGNNGKWVEMWLDGAKGSNVKQDYWFRDDWPIPDAPASWESVYKLYNPEIVTFGSLGDEMHWIGNENGIAGIPYWNRINKSKLREDYLKVPSVEDSRMLHRGDPNGVDWGIGECDFRITSGWFAYRDTNLKTLRALGDIYFQSIGRGAIFLMNVAPGPNGRVSDAQEARVNELGVAIRGTFKTDLAQGATVTASSYRNNAAAFKPENVLDGDYDTYWTMDDGQTTGTIEVDLGGDKYFDVVSIQEYIPLGQRISRYTVDVFAGGAWQPFGIINACQTIGYKALVRDFPVTASKVRVSITASQAVPLINSISVYKTVTAFELPGPSLIMGKPITASTTQGTTNVASRAVDSVLSVPTSTTSTSMSMTTPLSTYWGAATSARAATLEVNAGEPITFNKLWLFEYNANRITSYRIEYRNGSGEEWKVAYAAGAIDGETLAYFPKVTGQYVRLNILTASNTPNISHFGLYYEPSIIDLSVDKTSSSATAVLNYSAQPRQTDVSLIIAQYNSAGKLVAISTKSIELNGNNNETLTLDAVNTADYTFKAFLWDSAYIPLCEAATS